MSRVLFSVTEEELLKLLKEEDPNMQTLIRYLIFKDEKYMKSVVKELVKELVKKIKHRMQTRFKAASLLSSNPPTLYQVFVKSLDYTTTKQYSQISTKLYSSYEAAYNSVSDTPLDLIEIRKYEL